MPNHKVVWPGVISAGGETCRIPNAGCWCVVSDVTQETYLVANNWLFPEKVEGQIRVMTWYPPTSKSVKGPLKRKSEPDTTTWTLHEVRILYCTSDYERAVKKVQDFIQRTDGASTDMEQRGRGARNRRSPERFGHEGSCSEDDVPRSSDDEEQRTPKQKRKREQKKRYEFNCIFNV